MGALHNAPIKNVLGVRHGGRSYSAIVVSCCNFLHPASGIRHLASTFAPMPTSWVAESGSTKTTWVCIDDADLAPVRTTGFNPRYHSAADLTAALFEELPEAMRHEVTGISFFGAGCAGPEPRRTMQVALAAAFPQATQLSVEHDLLGAALGLCKGQPGLVGILGTGSHACYYDGECIAAEATNLGYMLGDEGSGCHLGKVLVQDFFYGRMPIAVADAFNAYLPLTRHELIDRVYRQPWPNRFLALLAPFLKNNLSEPYCQTVVAQAFSAFVRTHVLPLAPAGGEVHFTGSIAFHFKRVLQEVLRGAGLELGNLEPDVAQVLAAYYRALL